jgi:pyruvate dehydrogenase E2 component (dihydrolipoamide acetyltransferase)
MSHQIKMPKVAMAMNEGTITQWFKGDGEQVEKGEPLFEIETEKTAYEVEAPVSGQLQILVSAGETVKVETVIGALGDDVAVEDVLPISEPENNAGAEPSEVVVAEQLSPGEPGKRIKISPLAKKLADQNNIDLSLLSASGAHGRIKKRDIDEYLSNSYAEKYGF